MLSIIPPLPLFVLFLLLLFFSRNGFSQIHGFGSIDLKRMQAENLCNVVPPISRSQVICGKTQLWLAGLREAGRRKGMNPSQKAALASHESCLGFAEDPLIR